MAMQKILATALLGVGLLSGGMVQAAVVDLGDVGAISKNIAHDPGFFGDEFSFNITENSKLTSITNEFDFGTFLDIADGWSVNLYSDAGYTNNLYSAAISEDYLSFTKNLGVGTYYLLVAGYANGSMGGGYNVSLSSVPAPVPEPGEFALMLSGLGLMGYMVRRRKSNAA